MLDFLRNRGKSEHDWVEQSLSAYIDDELSGTDKARVERHLRECQACARSLSTLRQTVALLKELPTVPAPRSFALRPSRVHVKPRVTAPARGYGLLKGATALAALLLVLLVGGDLAFQVLGGLPMAARAPLAPAPELAFIPSPMPSVVPMPATEEVPLDHEKAADEWAEEAPPVNAEAASPPVPAPSEPAPAFLAPSGQEAGTPAATADGARPGEAPTVMGTPTGCEEIGAGAAEPTATTEATPSASATPQGEGPAPTVSPAPSAVSEERGLAPTTVPTDTPQAMAVAQAPQEEVHEREVTQPQAEVFPLSPLRVAELIVLTLLVLLIAATVMMGWLVRRSS